MNSIPARFVGRRDTLFVTSIVPVTFELTTQLVA
jgi:hypothetical protein